MNPAELKAVVEYMESERGVEREIIIKAIEAALQSATEKEDGEDDHLRLEINRKTFEIKAYRTLTDGSEIESTPRSLGRIAAQTAKQTIMQKIRMAEKERVFEEFKDRAGEIVTGAVTRFDRSDVIIDLEHAEAVMPSKERVPTEEYEIGERVRAYIVAVRERERGPEIILSRNHPDFVRRLFELEVSEISETSISKRHRTKSGWLRDRTISGPRSRSCTDTM
jgi:N utilization substance protein A